MAERSKPSTDAPAGANRPLEPRSEDLHGAGLGSFLSLDDLELDLRALLKDGAAGVVGWTNTSFPPSSGVMKPKPLAVLKNFTVPFGI